MEEHKNIPKHWKSLKVSDVGDLIRGVNYKKEETTTTPNENFLPILRGNNINRELNFSDLVYVKKKNISKTQLIQKGDIVIAMSSGSKNLVGKSAKANKDFHGAFGTFCGVFRASDKINKDFVAYFFQSPYYKKVISETSKGTNINNLKREHILNLDFPTPPLSEQLAIVSKIEELFSDLENGRQQLLTAQQQLKIYRQSLLKMAFEGRLTNKVVKEGELPNGWKIVELKEICEIKRERSKHRPRNEQSLFGGEYPFIQTGDIRDANGGYVKKFIQTYSEKGLQQSKLWPSGTLCITIAANIGETAILGFDACFPDSVVGLICDNKALLTRYANYFLIFHKSKLNELAPATAQKNINVDILEKVRIPCPPLSLQQIVVDELESKLTVCDKMEETIIQSLQQVDTLKQSILKKAFEGKLI